MDAELEKVIEKRYSQLYTGLCNFLDAEVFYAPYRMEDTGELVCRFCDVEQEELPAKDKHDMTCFVWRLREYMATAEKAGSRGHRWQTGTVSRASFARSAWSGPLWKSAVRSFASIAFRDARGA